MTLLMGSTLVQVIPFILLPILQKWFYSPTQFGELALYTSLTMLLAQVAGFKYEFAIVQANTEREAENVFSGTLLIIIMFTLVVAVAFNFFSLFSGHLFGVSEIAPYFYLIPFSVLFFSGFETFNYWNNRQKRYKQIAAAKITKTLAAETAKFDLAYYHNAVKGLVIGRVLGEFAAFILLIQRFIVNDWKHFHFSSLHEIMKSLKIHYRFPLFTMPSVFVGNLINLVFLSLFTSYFGAAKAGVIGISVIYISVAFGLIAQSFSQVFYKELNETKGKKELLKLYLGNAKYLIIISFMAVVAIQLIPSQWVAYLLGDQWIDLMPTLKVLIFSYAVSFVSSSLSFIYMRVNKQKQMLVFDIMHLVMVSASIYFAYQYYGTFMATLISYTIAQVAYYSFAFLIAIVFIKNMKDS